MTAKRNREEQLEALKRLDAYEIRQITDMKELHADGVVLSHKKTGARVFLLLADDPNKVFTIGFRTPPQDSTGVAHLRFGEVSGQRAVYGACEGLAQHLPECDDLSGPDGLPGRELQPEGL